MWRLSGILVIFAISGCAGMDAAECRTADWRAIGYEDGAQGRKPEYFGERRKACAEHGVAANFDAYLAGRTEGLMQFCRPHNGYQLGTQGRPYSGICPASLEAAFVAAHADGYGLYTRRMALNKVRKRLRYSEKRAKEIEYQLAENTALLISPDIEGSKRAAIAVELKQLAEEKVELEAAIRQLEHDRARAEREYDRYQDFVASRHRN
jgi:hypothetical protein